MHAYLLGGRDGCCSHQFGSMEFWAATGNDNLQAEDRANKSYQIVTDAGNAVC
jgi:hypothetical protein